MSLSGSCAGSRIGCICSGWLGINAALQTMARWKCKPRGLRTLRPCLHSVTAVGDCLNEG